MRIAIRQPARGVEGALRRRERRSATAPRAAAKRPGRSPASPPTTQPQPAVAPPSPPLVWLPPAPPAPLAPPAPPLEPPTPPIAPPEPALPPVPPLELPALPLAPPLPPLPPLVPPAPPPASLPGLPEPQAVLIDKQKTRTARRPPGFVRNIVVGHRTGLPATPSMKLKRGSGCPTTVNGTARIVRGNRLSR